jgi:excisionase family DNA binding protein
MDSNNEAVKITFAEPTLTKRDLARYFRVCERTIERLVAQGTLPAPIHIGRSLRWHPLDIDGFLAKQKEAGSSTA